MLNTAEQNPTLERISSRLFGVWTLVAYTEEKEGCKDTTPLGPKPIGFLIYTSDGYVSAQLMKPGRSAFQSRDWHKGTPEEYAESGSGYIAYCGTYEVDETNKTVSHMPFVALLPNLLHERQLRAIELNGDQLILRTGRVADADGILVSSHLEWQRVGRPATEAILTADRRKHPPPVSG
jgi:Lipocalin-like domain